MISLSRTGHLLIAAAIAIVGAVVLGAWLSSGSDSTAPATPEVAKPPPREEAERAAQPRVAGGTPQMRPAALSLETPPNASAVVWVRAGERVGLRSEPGGGELVEKVGRRTEFGSPSVFGVVRRSGGWVAVSTASLPNGELGWLRLDADRLRAGWTTTSIVVDLSERRADLFDAGRLVRSFSITVGAAESPTPTGRFAVTDTFRGGLNPAYGCCALALSATQPEVPSGWMGGNRIAIHGTRGTLGVAASKGCVRAADADVSRLVGRVKLGTPVLIRA